jgi:hypothetical protein
VGAAGQRGGDPQRDAGGTGEGLDEAGVVVRLPRVPFVYFCALLAGFLVGAAVGGDEGAVEDQVGKSLLSDFLQGVVQGGGQCPEDFDALVLVPVGGGLRDPEALAEAGEARPVAEPGEDEDGLLVAGQGAGSVPGAEFLPAFFLRRFETLITSWSGTSRVTR